MTEREIYNVVLGKLLLAVRQSNSLSQRQQAALAGVTQSSLSRFERGDTMPDPFELRGMVRDRPRFIELVDEVFDQTRASLRTLRKSYTKPELGAVVTLVLGGFEARDAKWLKGL